MDDKDFGIEYFKALRSHIDLRVRNQSYFTISKIVACGALFGHLAREGFTQGLVAVPLVAILLDFVIHHNLAVINSTGKYIRDELEKKCFKDIIGGKWVTYEAMSGQTQGAGVRDLLDRFGQIGITIAFFLLSLLVLGMRENWTRLFTTIWLVLTALLFVDMLLAVFLRASKR